ncbi:DUF6479 family protein, partial [Streptomyces umbrinus]
MDREATQLALSGAVVGGVVPFLVGLVLVGGLIWAVWWGRRVRAQEPGPPRPEDHRGGRRAAGSAGPRRRVS